MKKFYLCAFRYQSPLVLKFATLASLILTINYAPAAAQNFDTISWSTAAGQPIATHEVHGEVG